MSIKLYNLDTSPEIQNKYKKKVDKLLNKSDWVLGEELSKFESKIAGYIGSKYAVGVKSGTDALELSLRALNIQKGDEVIVPGYSFFSTSEVVLKIGAKPIYCDISKKNLNMDANYLKSLINSKTKAIIPVHLFGNPSDMESIKKTIENKDISIIEDVAQAFGSTYRKKKLGSIGEFGCFSFYPTKNLGAFGDGGAITTDSKSRYKKLLLLRNHGQVRRYEYELVGYNSRLDNIQAAILNIKLDYIKKIESKKIEILKMYFELLKNNKSILFLGDINQPLNQLPLGFSHISITNKVKKVLEKNNIEYGTYYPKGLHEYSFSEHDKRKKLPNIDWAKKHTITLPCHEKLKYKDIQFISELLINT